MGIKTMTPEQAKAYVKAGFFPDALSHQSLFDLRDAFGHLPYDFNVGLLADDETCENAAKLFELIWDHTTFTCMERQARDYREALQRRAAISTQLAALVFELMVLDGEIARYQERFDI